MYEFMIDLIFIGIIAFFIAAMLWSDRDSRRHRMPYLNDILNRDPSTFKEQKTIMLSTPTGPGHSFYDQFCGRADRDREIINNAQKQNLDEMWANRPSLKGE